MEPKKTKRAELESKKFIFLQIGFVITLAILIIAFEWSGVPQKPFELGKLGIDPPEVDFIPLTFPKEEKPQPPVPPHEFNLREDHVDLNNELNFPSVEALPGFYIPLRPFIDEPENPDPGDEIFEKVESMPTFRGKHYSYFREWIYQNISYPQKASENEIQGTVYVSFIVNKDGSVTDIEITRSVHPSLDNETVKVISSSPLWSPGKQRDKPVRVRFQFHVSYVIQ